MALGPGEILFLNLNMDHPAKLVLVKLKICELLTEKGLLTVPASDNIVRLTPPLIITNDEVDQAIEIINNVIKGIND